MDVRGPPPRRVLLTAPVTILALLTALYLFVGLGWFGLSNNNEALYAEIAREMLQTGDFTISHLNGLTYLEKPPLFPALVAGVFALMGETETAARLISALAAASCVIGMLLFGNALGQRRASELAALVLISCAGFVLFGRAVMPDMLLTALFNAALAFGFLAQRNARNSLWRLSLALLALATLTKGLLAPALYVLVFGTYFFVAPKEQRAARLRLMLDPWALALFCGIAVPWHVAAAMRDADFLSYYFVNEHVLRFLGRRTPHDYYGGSWLYYLPRLLVLLFPWLVYVPLLAVRASPREGDRDLTPFLWIAWLVPLAFFTLSVAKANYYMLIALPPLAMLVGMRLDALIAGGHRRLLSLPPLVLVFALAVIAVRYALSKHGLALRADAGLVQARMIAGGLTLALVGGSFAIMVFSRRTDGLTVLSLTLLPVFGLLLYLAIHREPYFTSKPLVAVIQSLCDSCKVVVYRDFDRNAGLLFYLKRPIGVLDSKSNELYFAQQRGEGAELFPTESRLIDGLREKPVLVVVDNRDLQDFRSSVLGGRAAELAIVGRRTVFKLSTR